MNIDKNVITKTADILKNYDGPDVRIMEVCGSHTAAIEKSGIRNIISDRIHLISGPGCPVCVTPSSYIDRLIEISLTPGFCVVTFGDLLRVPGSSRSLAMAKGEGACVKMVYSPADMIGLAIKEPETTFVFAAVGFETTTPVYALLLERIISMNIKNIRFLTALKKMPEAIEWLCENQADVDAFIAPGHVCVVTGTKAFESISEKYKVPMGVAGFKPDELILAIYGILKMIPGEITVKNFYPSVVTREGNLEAQNIVSRYFTACDAVWRGMGRIESSGMMIRKEYALYDAGSIELNEDIKINKACCCDRILTGRMIPQQCPLFGKVCTPLNPQGACMVSTEGSCCQTYSSFY